ncbi:MAG: hypothetical protein EXQ53_05320 [Acidobacteria bacterium]|nr:hypothetical protein [Acidobacteriota bacterium]
MLDPFCGCGTTIAAAQKLKRQWIGIDITNLAITLIRSRLTDAFAGTVEYEVIGEPVSLPDAARLAADKGIDGRIYFHIGDGKTRQIILSVKAGHVTVSQVRDLRGVLDRETADMGILISLEEPTARCGRKPRQRASTPRRGASTRGFSSSPSRTC